MEWSNDLSVSHLFLTHDVTITNDVFQYVIHIPSLRELVTNSFYQKFITLFQPDSLEDWRKLFPDVDKGKLLQLLMTEPRITNLKEFSQTSHLLSDNLKLLLPEFNIKERQLFSGSAPLDDEALSEILYILQLGIGKNVEKPQHFGPDEQMAKKFYERALAAKAKVQQIRAEAKDSSDGIISMFTMISYRFPMYTFEQMYDMTMYQLHYLNLTASAMLGYENGMTAYLTGNLKKPPKFFLK